MPWNKNFDMENAMQAFWQKGYEATSISDIINATGVQPYNVRASTTRLAVNRNCLSLLS